ncbi:ATP-binding protein [Nonomuraea sp. K274]|uniref:ATP-binding protein n=1 Tax=Nonomuraea cypriaca TaxID=1187855 RepID=A0A931EZU0_9ACTN|nr:ATP-binding protein [Nonomuraea cypriaca]MBF8185573.1 ATP-binding protein [Nonomuraea cypriaca]
MHCDTNSLPFSDVIGPELIDAMLRLRPGGLTWRRTFPGQLDQIPQARHFVRFLMEDSPHRHDIEQITAELSANAVVHTSSGQCFGAFFVELIRKPTVVRVTVYDSGWGATPRFDSPNPDLLAECGRGLAVVAALATRVGRRGTQALGHAVWAEICTQPS